MDRITIDFDSCSACKICVQACFVDVIRWDVEEKRPIVAYMEDCVACNACEIACPEQCIEVTPELPGRMPAHY